MMVRLLSRTFRSLKPHSNPKPKPPILSLSPSQLSQSQPSTASSSSSSSSSSRRSKSSKHSWCVYLILSTNIPLKTYVGVTTNFSRRLKQHNGELKGGAKASRAGRPWVCACIIRGFNDRGEACGFESKWKIFSRKLPRQRKSDETKKEGDNTSLPLLQHRHTALNRVKGSIDCGHLEIDWQEETCKNTWLKRQSSSDAKASFGPRMKAI